MYQLQSLLTITIFPLRFVYTTNNYTPISCQNSQLWFHSHCVFCANKIFYWNLCCCCCRCYWNFIRFDDDQKFMSCQRFDIYNVYIHTYRNYVDAYIAIVMRINPINIYCHGFLFSQFVYFSYCDGCVVINGFFFLQPRPNIPTALSPQPTLELTHFTFAHRWWITINLLRLHRILRYYANNFLQRAIAR